MLTYPSTGTLTASVVDGLNGFGYALLRVNSVGVSRKSTMPLAFATITSSTVKSSLAVNSSLLSGATMISVVLLPLVL